MSPQIRKGERRRPPIAHLAGLGALGATGGFALLFAGFLFITWPTRNSGMDGEHRAIAWISVGGLLLAIILMHVVLGKRLIDLGRGVSRMP